MRLSQKREMGLRWPQLPGGWVFWRRPYQINTLKSLAQADPGFYLKPLRNIWPHIIRLAANLALVGWSGRRGPCRPIAFLLYINKKIQTVGHSKLWWRRRLKGEMGCHGVKITVIMEQDQSFNNTESHDNYIYCFSYCNTSFSKPSVMPRTLHSDIVSTDLTRWKGAEEVFSCFVILVGSESLKNFR